MPNKNNSLEIRPVTEGDLPLIAEWSASSGSSSDMTENILTQCFEQGRNSLTDFFHVAIQNERPVGLIIVEEEKLFDPPRPEDLDLISVGEIEYLLVKKSERHTKGIGRALMKSAFGECTKRGFERVTVLSANEAKPFYEKIEGWKKAGHSIYTWHLPTNGS